MGASLNLLVLRASDPERLSRFYEALGLRFIKHRHGSGPEHYASEDSGIIFEIYPLAAKNERTTATRIGFRVPSVDEAVRALQEAGGRVVSPPKESTWGRRAVIDGPEGHRVELTEATTGQAS